MDTVDRNCLGGLLKGDVNFNAFICMLIGSSQQMVLHFQARLRLANAKPTTQTM